MDGKPGVEEDLLFHLKITEACKNTVLNSLMLIITPDIVSSFVGLKVCTKERFMQASQEHRQILQHIINGDGKAAGLAMNQHLQEVVEFSKTFSSST